jgi:tetratricopeptide (TPR) repeat protein
MSSIRNTGLDKHYFNSYPYWNRLLVGPTQCARLFECSHANPELAFDLLACLQHGKTFASLNYLNPNSIIDFYLSSMSSARRTEMAINFIGAGFCGSPISQRNFDTISRGALDEYNAQRHIAALSRYQSGQGPLVLANALAIYDRRRQIEALVAPSEVLMNIGLYDTWFEYFGPMFSTPDLLNYGSGNDPVNGLFINAAFVLYSMGHAEAALCILEQFLARFPESRFIPTVLYAQSMAYGRYQVPVDLPRAEKCARQNLALIDAKFTGHPRYAYIKVFAENAYAYIRAKQGNFKEALNLCETGIAQIVDEYGADQFKLHRSILIYNTAQVYELVGDLVQAEQRLRAAIDCDPYEVA